MTTIEEKLVFNYRQLIVVINKINIKNLEQYNYINDDANVIAKKFRDFLIDVNILQWEELPIITPNI